MNANELIDVLYEKEVYQESLEGKIISLLTNDTRKIIKDSCYVAIKGERFDGHDALFEAVDKGASVLVVEKLPNNYKDLQASVVLVRSTNRAQAILANKFYNYPTSQLNVVAVTGTDGKSTVSTMISDHLMILGRKTGLIGTIHYKIDKDYYVPLNTTPNAVELQSYFNKMVEAGCQDAIIEASSHALSLGRLWQTDVDVAIYTNLSREHLDYHKTMDNYAYAKSLLFSGLGHGKNDKKPKLAIVNIDDEYSDIMIQATSKEVLTYSIKDKTSTAYASEIEASVGHLDFNLTYKNKTYHITLPMAGAYNAENYMAAFLTLVSYYGFTPEEVVEATKSFKGVPGRMQSLKLGQDFSVVIDFAHTQEAIASVLEELRNSIEEDNKLYVLFGHSGGNRDSEARPGIGDTLFKYSDRVMITADNPRNEPVNKIASELIQDHPEDKYEVIEDRKEAIRTMVTWAKPGDCLVFLGKGGESYQVIGDEYLPYDEEAEVTKALYELLS